MKSFLLAAAGLLVLLAILLTILAVGACNAVRREGQIFEVWQDEIFDGLEPSERFPPRQANATALAIENLGAQIGIDSSNSRRTSPTPTQEAPQHWEKIEGLLRNYDHAVGASVETSFPTADQDLVAFTQSNSGSLARIRDLLLNAEPPKWELDVEDGLEAPIPPTKPQVHIHRLLLLSSSLAHQREDDVAARGFLEAAWRLGQGSEDSPQLLAKLIRFDQIGRELAFLRRLCSPGKHWEGRLSEVDFRSDALLGLQLEAWWWHHAARTGRIVSNTDREDYEQYVWFLRLYYFHHAEAVHHAVERLRTQDPLRFDNETFLQELSDRIPRWSRLSRAIVPNLFDSWIRAVRVELVVEHTRRILHARELLDRDELPIDGRHPSEAVPALSWLTTVDPAEVRISLDGEVYPEAKNPIALDIRLLREGCSSN